MLRFAAGTRVAPRARTDSYERRSHYGNGMDAPTGFTMSHTAKFQNFSIKGMFITKITTIGLDIAKYIFHVHGADRDGRPVIRAVLQ